MSKRVLISGGKGNFAKKIEKYNDKYEIVSLSKEEMDITDIDSLNEIVSSNSPDYFIHSGALTRPMVIHKEDPSKSIQINIIGTANVVQSCMKHNVKLIYISTDYVYPGTLGNYSEEDSLNPVNKYAWSKLGGECSVRLYDNHLILRTSMNKKPFPHSKALVDMKKSLMYIDEASEVVLKLLDEKGTINVGGKSQSVYDFVKETNSDVGEIYLDDIDDVNMATDCSMDTTKMKRLLDDTII